MSCILIKVCSVYQKLNGSYNIRSTLINIKKWAAGN